MLNTPLTNTVLYTALVLSLPRYNHLPQAYMRYRLVTGHRLQLDLLNLIPPIRGKRSGGHIILSFYLHHRRTISLQYVAVRPSYIRRTPGVSVSIEAR